MRKVTVHTLEDSDHGIANFVAQGNDVEFTLVEGQTSCNVDYGDEVLYPVIGEGIALTKGQVFTVLQSEGMGHATFRVIGDVVRDPKDEELEDRATVTTQAFSKM